VQRGYPPSEQRIPAWQALGVYTLLSQVGAGGMSTVWLAERNDGRFSWGRTAKTGSKREGKILGVVDKTAKSQISCYREKESS
jgi:hypothetical protein